jgi:hypothetical protein
MNIASYHSAIEAAKRFINLAARVNIINHDGYFSLEGPKETGALRRASMELTKALADLRKPG